MTPVYRLLVSARDQGPETVPGDTIVEVRVTDVNDNAPNIVVNTLLASDTNVAEVPEDAGPGTFVGHVIVTDPDSGANGRFNCSLADAISGGSGGGYFRLQAMYATEFQIVTTGRSLDRELVDRYDVTVTCIDGGRPAMTSYGQLTIHVSDVNDNWPTFIGGESGLVSSYSVAVFENNSPDAVIAQVSATDRDVHENGRVGYSLADHRDERLFAIDPDTGIIEARYPLDRELSSRHSIAVLAVDSGSPPRTATAIVEVTVRDVNDEKPRFDKSSYVLQVSENNPPGTSVATLTAHDNDAEPLDRFRFRLIPDVKGSDATTRLFEIDPQSGLIKTLATLDREKHVSHQLIAIVEQIDHRGRDVVKVLPGMSTNVSVIVQVIDENDNIPEFVHPKSSVIGISVANETMATTSTSSASPSSVVQLWNQATSGHVVTTVWAFDADTGANSRLDYVITGGNSDGLWHLDRTSGTLTTTRDLHGDVDNAVRQVTLQVADHGSPRLMSTAYLTVVINGSRPVVHKPTERYDRFSKSSPRVSSPFPTSIVIVGVSCTSGLALVLILTAVVCTVRCKRRRRRRRTNGHHHHHHRRHGNEHKQLPVDVLLDYPPPPPPAITRTDGDPETYDHCCVSNGSAMTSVMMTSSSTRTGVDEPRDVGKKHDGNGSCMFGDETSNRCAVRPDVIRRAPYDDVTVSAVAAAEQLSPVVDYGVKVSEFGASKSHLDEQRNTLNGLCGTRPKETRRRQSLLSNFSTTEVLRFPDLRQPERSCRTLSKEDLKLRCCQGPWQQQQQQQSHHQHPQPAPTNGGPKHDVGGHYNYLRPTTHCVNKTDPTRCNGQYCATTGRLKSPTSVIATTTSSPITPKDCSPISGPDQPSLSGSGSSCCRGLPHYNTSSASGRQRDENQSSSSSAAFRVGVPPPPPPPASYVTFRSRPSETDGSSGASSVASSGPVPKFSTSPITSLPRCNGNATVIAKPPADGCCNQLTSTV